MTTIVIEDGSVVAGANSYVTMAEYIAYAATLNITVEDSQVYQTQIIEAGQFIDGLESVLKGETTTKTQPMAYPRNNLTDIANWSWSSDEIPTQVKEAQMSLAIDIQLGEDLWNISQSGATGIKKEEVVGAVVVEYAVSNAVRSARRSRSGNLLSLLMKFNGLGIPLAMS
jgi:hypothetical protein